MASNDKNILEFHMNLLITAKLVMLDRCMNIALSWKPAQLPSDTGIYLRRANSITVA
jgi:hypothetical protein